MDSRRLWIFMASAMLFLIAAGCGVPSEETDINTMSSTGVIYLYGETHGVESILAQELEHWQSYYHDEGLRHLFVELPYFTAEYLNLYLRSEGDEILDAVYADWEGTASHVSAVREFYRQIKETCPETVFHGTDIGHQYDTTGKRYLTYLEVNSLQDSEQYALAQQAMVQGKEFYRDNDYGYRENRMVENFIREFDALADESVMGIYGTAHTAEGTAYQSSNTASMASQLRERYGDALHTEELKAVAKPLRMDIIEIGERSYQAAYLGRQDLSRLLPRYQYRDFWRLEDSYDDVKDYPKTGDVLPYDNYPAAVEEGQVFIIDYTLKDGTVMRKTYRADGTDWQGRPATEEFIIE